MLEPLVPLLPLEPSSLLLHPTNATAPTARDAATNIVPSFMPYLRHEMNIGLDRRRHRHAGPRGVGGGCKAEAGASKKAEILKRLSSRREADNVGSSANARHITFRGNFERHWTWDEMGQWDTFYVSQTSHTKSRIGLTHLNTDVCDVPDTAELGGTSVPFVSFVLIYICKIIELFTR